MEYLIKCNSETLICDACGEETKSNKWELKIEPKKLTMIADVIMLKCPNCLKSNVYEFAYHSHIEVK